MQGIETFKQYHVFNVLIEHKDLYPDNKRIFIRKQGYNASVEATYTLLQDIKSNTWYLASNEYIELVTISDFLAYEAYESMLHLTVTPLRG